MQEMCRDRYGSFPVAIFKVFSCSMCYNYLFHSGNHLEPDMTYPWNLIPTATTDQYPVNVSITADITNLTARGVVCKSLTDGDCDRWTDCCLAAIACCERQLSQPVVNTSEQLYCPRTWDGYGCFDDTLNSTRTYISCPAYVDLASPSATAYKDCTGNGTWWINPDTNSEWTNYTTCVRTHDLHVVVYVALACNVLSLMLLIPACVIFMGIRQLRVQKRIRLHMCLFLSFIFTGVVTIMWDFIVYLDRIQNTKYDTIMHKNSGWCKLLYVLTRYGSTCNFFWMFCEGFYLHRLIVHAFAVPKTLIGFYIFGWVGSWVPAVIYSIIRATNADFNHSCWVHNIDWYEWIMYTPNLLCLALNFGFMFNILRILCSKLQAHPNEPSNYRKALKATFVLIPLFGLQQFVVIYRPTPESPLLFTYEIFQNVVINTQGAAVALIFCFLNGEVYGHIRSFVNRLIKSDGRSEYLRKGSTTSATQFTSITSSVRRGTRQCDDSERGYIPLSTSSTTNDVTDSAVTPLNGHVTFAL